MVVWMHLQWALREQASMVVCSVTLFTEQVVVRSWFASSCCWWVVFKLGYLCRWEHKGFQWDVQVQIALKTLISIFTLFYMPSFLKMILLVCQFSFLMSYIVICIPLFPEGKRTPGPCSILLLCIALGFKNLQGTKQRLLESEFLLRESLLRLKQR